MTGLTGEQATVIQQLRRIWSEEQFVVVGATAIGCHLEFRWRKTHDLDLCIAADIEECRHALQSLPGWTRHERILHAWTAPGEVRIDVVLASAEALRTGRIDWPDGGTMSAVGLRAAFADAVRFDVGDCDDADASTYPGAPELNDGRDNRCAGDAGYGVADEISSTVRFTNPVHQDELCWMAQAGATSYELVRAEGPGFPSGCVTMTHAGSWGQDSTGVERAGGCLAP